MMRDRNTADHRNVRNRSLTMETLAPAPWRSQVLLCMAVTLSLAMSLVDGDSASCTPGINMSGHQNSITPLGQPLTLKCPVRLCHPGLPNVTWCKISGDLCDEVRTGEGIYFDTEDRGEDRAVYVLRFLSVQMNDTGYYRCKAVFKDHVHIVGKSVEVAISGLVLVPGGSAAGNVTAVNITQTGSTETFQDFTLLLYVVSSMGGACILIMTVSLAIYYQKHLKVKNGPSPQDPAPTEELQFVAAPGTPKYEIQAGTPTPMDIYSNSVTVEVTYDNAHMGYKSTAQKASVTEEDSIVYADLNYNAAPTGFHLEDNCEVEYATVHVNDKIICNE